MKTIAYDRYAAVAYAQKWAYSRNPAYYDFSAVGGDCTSFASQCLFAGCKVMNFTPIFGWFYRSANDRTAAWTGVEYFYKFLTDNSYGNLVGDGSGPFAEIVPLDKLTIGDFVQFGRATGDFYHTPIVVGFQGEEPLLAAHSNDTFARPLSSWNFARLRCIHILGARTR
jgi:hypothetical protein